jgi:hypothetical protein
MRGEGRRETGDGRMVKGERGQVAMVKGKTDNRMAELPDNK